MTRSPSRSPSAAATPPAPADPPAAPPAGAFTPTLPDIGLVLIRIMLGIVGFYHGGGKLFGLFGGPSPSGFAKFLEMKHVPLSLLSAYLAGAAEFFGGLCILLGLVTPAAAALFAFNMLVAFFLGHGGRFDTNKEGGEYALTLCVVAGGLMFTGPGRLSLDAHIWKKNPL